MEPEQRVIDTAKRRGVALASGDADELSALLHPDFIWTSHIGETFDRDEYVHSNTGGGLRWRAQNLGEVSVKVVADTAVLTCVATDEVEIDQSVEVFRMPMTQTWVFSAGQWLCLAGHAGPRLSA